VAGLVPVVALLFLPAWPAAKEFALATGTTGLALVWGWRRARGREASPVPPLAAPLAALVGAGALSIVNAAVPWDSVRGLYVTALLILAYLVVAEAGPRGDQLVLAGVALTATTVALVGIAQVLAPARFTAWAAEGRAIGTLGNTNYAGAFLAPSLVVALGLGLAPRDRLQRGLLGLAVALIGTGLVLTRARGAWVGAAAGMAALLALAARARLGRWDRQRLLVSAAVLAGALVAAELILRSAGQSVGKTLATLLDPAYPSNAARLAWWAGSLRLAQDAPLLGVGPGNFPAAYVPLIDRPDEYYPAGLRGDTGVLANVEHPHNELVNFAAERGLVGLGVLVWAGAALLRVARPRLAAPGGEAWLAATATAALLAGLVHGQFFYVLREPATATLLAVLLGVLARPTGPSGPRPWWDRGAAAGVALAAVLAWAPLALAPAVAAGEGQAGRSASRDGDQASAAAALARARAWEPRNSAWAFEVGLAQLRLERPDAAVRELEAGLQLNPSDLASLNNLGVALMQSKRLAAAREVYRRGLAMNPRFASAYQNLGIIAMEEGRAAEAVGHLTRAVALLGRHPAAEYNLGVALARTGDRLRAAAAFRKAVALDPSLARAWYALAQVEASHGRLAEARQALGRAIAASPGLRQSARADPLLAGLLDGG
jgi:O-antigen ligase/Flp pilus assembly protein TadD